MEIRGGHTEKEMYFLFHLRNIFFYSNFNWLDTIETKVSDWNEIAKLKVLNIIGETRKGTTFLLIGLKLFIFSHI